MIRTIGARGTTTTRYLTITATARMALISAPACTSTFGINLSERPSITVLELQTASPQMRRT